MRMPEPKPVDIVYADPPWKFASNSAAKPGRNAMRHYPCMTDAELCAMPVKSWLADDALLFMWTTAPMLERSMRIPAAWGFKKYITHFVWPKSRTATGYWIRNRHELLMIYKRGKFPRPDNKAPFADSVITGPTREHSRKPDGVADEIARIWPDAVKLEMFARTRRPGWCARGNQVDLFS